MKRLLATALTLALFAGLPMMQAEAQTKLRLLSSWNKNNWPTYAVVDHYQKLVQANADPKIEIQIFGEEVVPPFEQLQPAKAGVFDMLFTHGVYHAGSKGIALVVDAIDMDVDKRREVGVWKFVDEYYQRNNNLKMVAMPSASTQGYHIFLREPLTPEGDFKGRKIRGTQSYHGIIKALGGAPVVLPGGQIYTALEKGVVDGAAWPAAGMLSMKHYEVAKYRMRPTFGVSTEPVFVNLDKWKKLPANVQKVLLDKGLQLEKEMPALGDAIQKQEDEELDKLGVKITMLPPDKVALVKKVWAESLWELAEQCCADGAKELRQIAMKANLTQ
jgi:TRAP-type C4-dicarboxylate transport system substrate-binding protein